jgi:hypothetical protein
LWKIQCALSLGETRGNWSLGVARIARYGKENKEIESKLQEYKGKENTGIGRELKKRMRRRAEVREGCPKDEDRKKWLLIEFQFDFLLVSN